ncbi:Hypothetical predicted protein [Podarcis lilfordi]|nr:Hypothetical predicted protein [Podarcis lilfordi]
MMLWLQGLFLLATEWTKARERNGSHHNLTKNNQFPERGTVNDDICLASEQWSMRKGKEEPSIPLNDDQACDATGGQQD